MPLYNPGANELAGTALDPALKSDPTGTLARAIPRAVISSGTLASLNTTGQVAVRSIGLAAGTVVTNITFLSGTTPANTPTHWWVGLTDSSLNVLAVSADQTSGAIAASTPVTVAMGTPYTVAASAVYYVAVSFTGTTAPTLAGVAAAAGLNVSSPTMCGTAGTQSTPPSLAAQLNSGTVNGNGGMNFAAWIT